jgi:hypothetical protein
MDKFQKHNSFNTFNCLLDIPKLVVKFLQTDVTEFAEWWSVGKNRNFKCKYETLA